MSTLYVMVGIPASGKTSVCKELEKKGVKIFSTDAIRHELFGDEALQYTEEWLIEHAYNGADEHLEKSDFASLEVFRIQYERINAELKIGHDVVADAVNNSVKVRKKMLSNCSKYADKIVANVMATPYELCLERNSKRDRTVPPYIMKLLADDYEEPTLDEGFDEIIYYDDKNDIDYGKANA